jgi:hypothetical protein
MPTITDPTAAPGSTPLKRIGWFVALWAAGVAVTAAVAYGLRLIIFM